jgi:hypothetical protein
MLSRGGRLTRYLLIPEGDMTWSVEDWARAKTIEARWSAIGVSEDERRRYIPCAVLMAKFPGIHYPDAVMKRLSELATEVQN